MYRKKNIVIITMCVAVLLMIVGYAAFSANLKINGAASITSNWNIYFESITTKQITGSASNAVEPTVSALSARFEYNFKLPGDKIVYEIVLKNGGTLDAIVSEINAEQGGTGQMLYAVEGIQKGDKILAGQSRTITITIEFDREATFIPEIKDGYLTIDLTCIQANDNVTSEDLVVYQPMLKVSAYSGSCSIAFLNGPITRESIESITFTNSKTVPSGVIDSWDVSANSDGKVMAWYLDADSDNLYEVVIGQDGGVIANPNSSHLFSCLTSSTNIDFTYFDTSKVTNMLGMFMHSSSLIELDLSGLDTSKVTSMNLMFYNCSSLITLDVSNFNTSEVTDMYAMFHSCNSLTELDLSNFDTSKVTNMKGMFAGCGNLNTLDFSAATFNSVTNYTNMFNVAYSTMTIKVKSETERIWILDKLSTANVIIA